MLQPLFSKVTRQLSREWIEAAGRPSQGGFCRNTGRRLKPGGSWADDVNCSQPKLPHL